MYCCRRVGLSISNGRDPMEVISSMHTRNHHERKLGGEKIIGITYGGWLMLVWSCGSCIFVGLIISRVSYFPCCRPESLGLLKATDRVILNLVVSLKYRLVVWLETRLPPVSTDISSHVTPYRYEGK